MLVVLTCYGQNAGFLLPNGQDSGSHCLFAKLTFSALSATLSFGSSQEREDIAGSRRHGIVTLLLLVKLPYVRFFLDMPSFSVLQSLSSCDFKMSGILRFFCFCIFKGINFKVWDTFLPCPRAPFVPGRN